MHFTLGAYFKSHFRQFYHGSILYGPWLDCTAQQTDPGPYWVALSGSIRDIAWRQILKWNKQLMITDIYRLKIVDMLQGDLTIIVQSPWGYRRMTVRCPYDFMSHARASPPAATMRASYDYRKSLRSFLGQNWQWKIVRCPHDRRAVPVLGSFDVTAMCLGATG